jgi:tricorn protease
MAQWKKDGLIIDERWNSGGQIPDRFIELLNRPICRTGRCATRRRSSGRRSRIAAAGDADQRLERIGRRRVSVLLPRGRPRTAHRHAHVGRADRHQRRAGARRRRRHHRPDLPHVRPEGQWFAEGHGVDPDIPVEDDPSQIAKGTDPQLQRAIEK